MTDKTDAEFLRKVAHTSFIHPHDELHLLSIAARLEAPAVQKPTRSQRMTAAGFTRRPSGKTAGGLMFDPEEAAPAQKRPVAEEGPWQVGASHCKDGKHSGVYIESDDFTHDVRLYISGDFADENDLRAYAVETARRLAAAPAQDTAIALLRELVNLAEIGDADQDELNWHPVLEEARALLADKEPKP